jgi:hypothetical protein
MHCYSQMPGFQDPFPGDPQRAWQRRANPVRIALLHLALESRDSVVPVPKDGDLIVMAHGRPISTAFM